MLAILAARPDFSGVRAYDNPPLALTRWQRWRGLFDVGWDARNRTPMGQRLVGMAISLLVNLFFVLFMLASLYLRWGAVSEPEPEPMRIRITGFGSQDQTGGGEEAAAGDLASTATTGSGQANPAGGPAPMATRQHLAAEVETAPAMALPNIPEMAALPLPDSSQVQVQTQPLPSAQPLQVTTPPQPSPDDFQLPPPRPAMAMTLPAVQLRSQNLPSENALPAPLPEVRAISLPSTAVRSVQAPAAMPAEAPIPEPLPAPAVNLPELGLRRSAPQLAVREVGQRALPALPDAPQPAPQTTAAASTTQAAIAASAASAAATATATSSAPSGLPDARGRSAQPGQNAPQTGAGPQPVASSSGWPDPVRGDDWGAAAQSRAGQARGNEQGTGRGQGGSGLFNADGRPRLADDSFKPRFPDPTREGTWLRRPGMETRGTMFDGIWRPPETLLQEWVRRGVKSIRIPIPGTTLELECVISTLQATGGCLLVPGKNGVFDQPARARQPPEVPFKPELFEDPEALQPAGQPPP
ncbi:hypothetical protein CO614_04430 [Lysobacteraceae bacterium NML120232]|nr:hypothetical protein CO614_04430 [Xanthomonadaceae bacterium NML120232]